MSKGKNIVSGDRVQCAKTGERGVVVNIHLSHRSPYTPTEYQVKWDSRRITVWVPNKNIKRV